MRKKRKKEQQRDGIKKTGVPAKGSDLPGEPPELESDARVDSHSCNAMRRRRKHQHEEDDAQSAQPGTCKGKNKDIAAGSAIRKGFTPAFAQLSKAFGKHPHVH